MTAEDGTTSEMARLNQKLDDLSEAIRGLRKAIDNLTPGEHAALGDILENTIELMMRKFEAVQAARLQCVIGANGE